jgi:hypothetical protein
MQKFLRILGWSSIGLTVAFGLLLMRFIGRPGVIVNLLPMGASLFPLVGYLIGGLGFGAILLAMAQVLDLLESLAVPGAPVGRSSDVVEPDPAPDGQDEDTDYASEHG